MDDEFSFPDADLYQHVYNAAPPTDESKSILSLPTEIIVGIAQLNFKTAIALMCTNRVLHAAGVTALYARVFLRGRRFNVLDPDAPNLIVPGVLGGLLAKQEHTVALRYLKVVSLPYDAHCRSAFRTLVYRVFERAHGLVFVDLMALFETEHSPSPINNLLQLPYPRNLHTLRIPSPTGPFASHLLTTPSLKEVRFGDPCCWWDNTLEYCQGPYSQVTSLFYIHQGVGPHTMSGDSLNLFELFPSVERIGVSIGKIRDFLESVPHIGISWAKVKHLTLWVVFDEEQLQPPADERTKGLLIGALNTLCPALDACEVRTRVGIMWRVMWVDGQRMFT